MSYLLSVNVGNLLGLVASETKDKEVLILHVFLEIFSFLGGRNKPFFKHENRS